MNDDSEMLSFGEVALLKKEIIIDSQKFSNEGRFFSGVSTKFEKKANCEFRLFDIDGLPRCFIFAIKQIEKNDILYLHYGEEYDEVAKSFKYQQKVNF